jgi:SAM-dependent methyltransferase
VGNADERLKNLRRQIGFARDFLRFRTLSAAAPPERQPRWDDRYPCLGDATESTSFDAHYVYHTAWAARKVRELNPAMHIDVSSSPYFNAIVSAWVPVTFYDFRPANLHLPGLAPKAADVTALPFGDRSVASLSCMHVVEHIGLGRYGDRLDPDGDLKAMRELSRVLAPGGSLLFVVPVGRPRVAFNAHRIYAASDIARRFASLSLREFALIPDRADAGMVVGAPFELADQQSYGCGCFHFVAA